MKEHLRNKLFSESIQVLSDLNTGLPESQARKIGSRVAENSIRILIENNQNMSEHYKDLILEAEQTKKMFREHIEVLQSETQSILKILKTTGMVKMEWNSKLKKNVLVAKTSVLQETVAFLNKMNTLVIDFYKDVYKVEETNNEDRLQITLF